MGDVVADSCQYLGIAYRDAGDHPGRIRLRDGRHAGVCRAPRHPAETWHAGSVLVPHGRVNRSGLSDLYCERSGVERNGCRTLLWLGTTAFLATRENNEDGRGDWRERTT